jgi:uncharacterized protein YraI
MCLREPGRLSARLSAAVALVAGSALVPHLAAAQFYYSAPPPTARFYYPPPAVQQPPALQQDDRPVVTRPDGPPPAAQLNSREDNEDRDDRPGKRRGDRAVASREDRDDQPAIGREDRPAANATPDARAGALPSTTTPARVVSLRAGPSGGDAVIGTLHPGMPLDVLGTSHGWVQVRSSAGTGWAYGSYLAIGAGALSAASANDGASNPARTGDDGAATPAATTSYNAYSGGRNNAPKPAGTANPALSGGGTQLPIEGNRGFASADRARTSAAGNASAEADRTEGAPSRGGSTIAAGTGRTGLASQITSP